jgi:hypothetical protein
LNIYRDPTAIKIFGQNFRKLDLPTYSIEKISAENFDKNRLTQV